MKRDEIDFIAEDRMANPSITSDTELGYMFTPPCHHDHPCHRQLDIVMHDKPTLRHYDPESAQFTVTSIIYGIEVLKIRHPGQREANYHVIPSSAIMRDRIDKVIVAFTFGGTLHIVSDEACTRCTLKSTAPILPLIVRSSVITMLADEVRILLAERRAVWNEEHPWTAFEEQLATVDPFVLYLSCLDSLQEKFSHFPHPVPEHMLRFNHFLKTEIDALYEQQLWPTYVPPLSKLL